MTLHMANTDDQLTIATMVIRRGGRVAVLCAIGNCDYEIEAEDVTEAGLLLLGIAPHIIGHADGVTP